MKRYLLFCLLVTLLITSCTRNRVTPINSYVPDVRILPFEGQAWLWQVPQGDYAIGISYSATHFQDGVADAARDFAAVSLSRNHASFIVDKQSIASLTTQEGFDERSADFNVVVSQNLSYLRYAADNLRLIHHFDTHGYFLGLYGFEDATLDSSRLVMTQEQIPPWALRPGLRTERSTIYSTASSRQASLIDAFFAAQELALRQIGRHLTLKVMDTLQVEDDLITRTSAFESVSQSRSFNIDKVYIRRLQIDSNFSYEATIQLREAVKL